RGFRPGSDVGGPLRGLRNDHSLGSPTPGPSRTRGELGVGTLILANERLRPPLQRPFRAGLRIVLARLRFFVLLGAVLLLVAAWPWLRNHWEKLTRPAAPELAVSGDTEYWCPMCPGVVSDWPGKCPVCKMDLIRRRKAEMTPLPDGTLSRMQ